MKLSSRGLMPGFVGVPLILLLFITSTPVFFSGCSLASAVEIAGGNDSAAFADSVTYFTMLANELPDEPEVYYNRGIYRFRLQQYREAIADFSYALKVDSGFYAAYLTRGDCQRMLGNDELAVENYDQFYFNTGGGPYLFKMRAYSNFRLKKYPVAIHDYSKLIILGQGDAYIYSMRGRSRLYNKEFTSATRDFTEAIKLAPDTGSNYIWLGNAYYGIADWNKSIDSYLTAIEKKANMAEENFMKNAYFERAQTLHQDNPGQALKDLAEALKIDPDYPEAIYQQGLIFYNEGLKDKACMNFERAAELGIVNAFQQIRDCCLQ